RRIWAAIEGQFAPDVISPLGSTIRQAKYGEQIKYFFRFLGRPKCSSALHAPRRLLSTLLTEVSVSARCSECVVACSARACANATKTHRVSLHFLSRLVLVASKAEAFHAFRSRIPGSIPEHHAFMRHVSGPPCTQTLFSSGLRRCIHRVTT